MALNITQEGIDAVLNSTNAVLEAMGFESVDEEITAPEVKEAPKREPQKVETYGGVVYNEIEKDVFEVCFKNQDVYLNDLKTKRRGFFVGE